MGDLEVPIKIYYTSNDSNKNTNLELNNDSEVLNIENISKIKADDVYICIDNRTHLIEGLDSNFNKTGTLYNRFITSGDFFLLPTNRNILTANVDWNLIKFNYLYY
jgi:hypothetical protein